MFGLGRKGNDTNDPFTTSVVDLSSTARQLSNLAIEKPELYQEVVSTRLSDMVAYAKQELRQARRQTPTEIDETEKSLLETNRAAQHYAETLTGDARDEAEEAVAIINDCIVKCRMMSQTRRIAKDWRAIISPPEPAEHDSGNDSSGTAAMLLAVNAVT